MSALRLTAVIALVAAVVAAPPAHGQEAPPAPAAAPLPAGLSTPFPKAEDPAAFARWWIESRDEVIRRIRVARAASDPKEVARLVSLLEDLKHHALTELRRAAPPRPAGTPDRGD